jgi:glyoxylase-like metal-dependent hydrolase (beta-lactamase superfamily II)
MLNKTIKEVILCVIIGLIPASSFGQRSDEYEVYALKYLDGGTISGSEGITGADPRDSLQLAYMVWLLKSTSGKNILVDAGFLDTAKVYGSGYIRPDLILQNIGINPSEISDIILTHPHSDHIGGINLFPKAVVWLQEDDYNYFIGEAWQKQGIAIGFQENDVRNLVELNLAGRLKLIMGDNLEIFPGVRVFIGSKHSYENQYILVNSNSQKDRVLIASDAVWFYQNLIQHRAAVICHDAKAYVDAMERMKTLVINPDLIIPGHDDQVFSRFIKAADGVVRIGDDYLKK